MMMVMIKKINYVPWRLKWEFIFLVVPLDFPLFLVVSADVRRKSNFSSQFASRQSCDVYTRFWAKIQDFLKFRTSTHVAFDLAPPGKFDRIFCYENPTKIPKVTKQKKTKEKVSKNSDSENTSTPKINSKIFLRLWLSPFCAYQIKFIFSYCRNVLQK